jgi:energy-coupling factor transporter ATP-binding protein EcfA2
VSKEEIMSSIRAIELFAKSEESTATMKDKDIVAFYENTGAGKSTSINYFLRVPLETTVNRYGDTVVEAKRNSIG